MIGVVWNGTMLVEPPRAVRLEGNHYFPPELLHREHLTPGRANASGAVVPLESDTISSMTAEPHLVQHRGLQHETPPPQLVSMTSSRISRTCGRARWCTGWRSGARRVGSCGCRGGH